jgi:hypothetical protein
MMRYRKYLFPKWAEILVRKKQPPAVLDSGGIAIQSLLIFVGGLKNNQLLNSTDSLLMVVLPTVMRYN